MSISKFEVKYLKELMLFLDKNLNENNLPIPMLLVVSAIHYHLIEVLPE